MVISSKIKKTSKCKNQINVAVVNSLFFLSLHPAKILELPDEWHCHFATLILEPQLYLKIGSHNYFGALNKLCENRIKLTSVLITLSCYFLLMLYCPYTCFFFFKSSLLTPYDGGLFLLF